MAATFSIFAINDFYLHSCKREGGNTHVLREVDAVALCLCGNGIVAPSEGAAELGWVPQADDSVLKPLTEVMRYMKLPSTSPVEADRYSGEVGKLCAPLQRNAWAMARNLAAAKGWNFLLDTGIRGRVRVAPEGAPSPPTVRVNAKQNWYFRGSMVKAGEPLSIEAGDAAIPLFAGWMRLIDPEGVPKIEAVASHWYRLLAGQARLTPTYR